MDTFGVSSMINSLADYVWPFTRSLLILALVYVNYQFVRLVWCPLRTKRIYSKFPNVLISELETLPKKDQDLKKKNQAIDARFYNTYNQYFVELVSLKAVKEFDTVRPHVLDRSSYMSEFTHKLIPNSIKITETNESFKQRKMIYRIIVYHVPFELPNFSKIISGR